MRDEHGVDAKIIAVHVNDPAVRDHQTLADLPAHLVAEMRRFFEDYKVLEGKPVAVGGDLSRAQAIEVLRSAARRYREHHP